MEPTREAAPTTPRPATSAPLDAWYHYDLPTTIAALNTSATGLDAAAVALQREQYGSNELHAQQGRSPLRMLVEQFANTMVIILLAAALLSLFLDKRLEAGAIFAIVGLFTLLGFFQEYRAERAIAALKQLTVPSVRTYRDGQLAEVSARDLVPGDLILLEAGNILPADVRISASVNLRIQEAALTGESLPVSKVSEPLAQSNVSLADRRNMGYMGTTVSYGRGSAFVVATGMRTELGKIADLLQRVTHEPTPLQQRLDRVGKQLAIAGVAVALLILAVGLFMGEALGDMILTAISVAVAVIPEGLPAVVTFTLAIGGQRMLRRNALVRKLPAVETLGSVTTICSDKTGTLTANRMTVTRLVTGAAQVDLEGCLPQTIAGAVPGDLLADDAQGLDLLLAAGVLCNDAELTITPETGAYSMLGDPTEGALLVVAAHAGLRKAELAAALPRVAELPFDSERKRMTTVHARGALDARLAAVWGATGFMPTAEMLAFTKGAVDGMLEITSQIWINGHAAPLDAARRAAILAANAEMAGNGMRILGVAFRPLPAATANELIERELIFLGLVAMIDPPRPEVAAAVATCREAGIRPIMITGDHPLTASYIARELGITQTTTVVTGAQLEAADDGALDDLVKQSSVFARVSPEHKLRIVAALRSQGQVVAMTGDGVNDAPALKQADIGVAMGITGTDVSREASDMVLRDDNFATIVAAVEEGRVIYDNLRRFVKFAVAGNIGKVAVMLFWPAMISLLGLPIGTMVALLPLQLLWLNLMTDGLLGLSMGFEPAERSVMRRPPHRSTDGIFAGGMGWNATWVGLVIGILSLGVGGWYYVQGLSQWQTMMVTTLAFLQVFQALATRSNTESLLSIGIFSNRVMWGIIVLVVGLQLLALYTPLNIFLGMQPLAVVDLLLCVGLGVILFLAIEIEKWVKRML
ncbi:MAG: cation-translocating P-type ATPase [Candidatus Viridilinea halotolerans]|uniref:Cation-translocating P-type ATPase n=1 Tax=Candidatus Viridilinea halotolerans TaxID=2491704 RepID=A0A426U1K7_9CHLR|nr:MAG: cation-translocating P-type ATPase [Candidatus Viridilinea halotolerans]